jgi:CheY-like chemotaxis protein
MTPAIYLLKCQLWRPLRTMAVFFFVIGAAMIAATLIVQISAAGFRFGPPAPAKCALLFVILTTGLLVRIPDWIRLRKQSNWSFWSADDVLVWQDQFANNEQKFPLILIASDDVFMRSALDFHLTRAGFRVEHAAGCDEAVSKMGMRPEIVLLDINMPNGNRFYCLRDVRKMSPSTKVIALTPKCQPEDAILCRKLGAYDSLPKPLDPNDVVTNVARALSGERVEEISLALSA